MFKFEHIVRNANGTVQYAVLADGETRQIIIARWDADVTGTTENVAAARYPEGETNSATRAARDEAVRLAHALAQEIVALPTAKDWQRELAQVVEAIDPETLDRISPLRRRAEEQQDREVQRLTGRRRTS